MEAFVSDKCILCGLCIDKCPEVFVLGETIAEVLVEKVPREQEQSCREAATVCPTGAIELG